MPPLLQLIFYILFLAILLTIGVVYLSQAEISPELKLERRGEVYLQGNTLVPISSLYFPHTFVYGTIISCLIDEESDGNPNAFNPKDTDGYPKYGLLQYHKPTFQEFCVERYKLRDDILDPEIQKFCADRMIRDGYGYLWGTWDKCVD